MISGSLDKTTRQWDLKAGKEIEGARDVCEGTTWEVAVSQDGRWVGQHDSVERESTALISLQIAHCWRAGHSIEQRGYGTWRLANLWLVH
jgi:hypothetical protein